MTATSVAISWTIPEVLHTQEVYYVQYGLEFSLLDQNSTSQSSNGSDTDVSYTITIEDLHPDNTYYFVVTSENTVAPKSTDISTFTTLEAGTVSIENLIRVIKLWMLQHRVGRR